MCTVSFVNSGGKTIITSNRDEQVARPAIAPKRYTIANRAVYFPKDPQAGGTWYAVSETGTVLVLLNGAAEKHHHNPPYRKSRGLIVLDIISAESPLGAWEGIDLTNIEPFTLVLFEQSGLYQLRWDGTEKQTAELDAAQNHIWSSSTLYPAEVRQQRAGWFATFLEARAEITAAEMLDFHRYTEKGNTQNGLVINRNEQLKTLSITQAVIDRNKIVLSHCDLQQDKQFTNSFSIQ